MTRPILRNGTVVIGAITVPPVPPEDTARAAEVQELVTRRGVVLSDVKIQAIASRSPAQARAWVDANVTNLAQAKDLLGDILAVLTVLLKKL